MANRVEQTLTEELFPLLQKERYVTIATTDHETNGPNVTAISWIFAPTMETIRFAIDNRSRMLANMKAESRIVISLIANGSTYSISGSATIVTEKIEAVPLKLALVEVQIEEVRDVMFYGAKMVTEPQYDKTYDAEAAAKLDRQVMDALKKA
ncbi:pyridoxamine 5'-phosphate oxidase family protein [Alkalihalobacillus oceani]|uniref:Pyridoxamine 5'-phosphate oxidase family protein n=1 Tax=Halalkalibacter oceani TaxID=1653776 RepID=A0A9X2DM67_9BACI|nr:pyridoxamine 5'-phosphate oxidase family protein [Halalkalibacter oceani]MCM3713056.1 pyridoxamine 5'-phosphate oxidase family protein [Halalkalibacter oceani]